MKTFLTVPIAILIGALTYSIPAYLHEAARAQTIAAKAALAAAEKCGGSR